jgi:hypothetical protein
MTFWDRLARKLETAANSWPGSSSTFVRLGESFLRLAAAAAVKWEFLTDWRAAAIWSAAGESLWRRAKKEGAKDEFVKRMKQDMERRANRAKKAERCLAFLGWTKAMTVARGRGRTGCGSISRWMGRDMAFWRGVVLETRERDIVREGDIR